MSVLEELLTKDAVDAASTMNLTQTMAAIEQVMSSDQIGLKMGHEHFQAASNHLVALVRRKDALIGVASATPGMSIQERIDDLKLQGRTDDAKRLEDADVVTQAEALTAMTNQDLATERCNAVNLKLMEDHAARAEETQRQHDELAAATKEE